MPPAPAPARLVFPLLLGGTLLGLAGTDLVLPAVPDLPAALGGTPGAAQLVLAAFVAGSAVGLLAFGALGGRFDQRRLLAVSLLLYAGVSASAGWATSLAELIWLRLLQGAAGSAAATFAPGFIRALYDERRAVRALGLLGSVESLVPALAPLAGAWLAARFGWPACFHLIAILALLLAAAFLLLGPRLPALVSRPRPGGYRALLRDPVFLRYAISQATTLGGLLVFVFGAPAVITGALGGTIRDYVGLQVGGIAFFILGANLAGRLAARFGAERMILLGTVISAAGGLMILAFGLAGGRDTLWLTLLFVPMNLGLGLRGPPGFYRAVLAAQGDDARGAALVILGILLTAAGGTALVAPWITEGLVPLGLAVAAILLAGLACLLRLPALPGH